MVYKRFFVQVFLRTGLVLINVCLFAWFLLVDPDYIKAAFVLLTSILFTLELIRYVNKSNRDFREFIHLLRNDDFSTRFNAKNKGRSFENLYNELNSIGEKYHKLILEKEIKHRHLITVLEHVDIGIISIDATGHIQLVNRAFQDLFRLPYLEEDHTLDKLDPAFVETILSMAGGSKKLLRLTVDERELHLTLQATVYKLMDEEFRLITVKNIISELEQHELESYQKLIRVLTHEIMNSITPITSLSSTLDDLLKANKIENNDELAEQVKTGIAAIHDRSSNLLKFTKSYRKLTRLPQPEVTSIDVKDLIQSTQSIARSFPEAEKVQFQTEVPNDIQLDADPKMIEQVIINIYKNALESLVSSSTPSIITRVVLTTNQRIKLEIEDNGPGMKTETLEKVFIPFYTTKAEGSGIGMSLCRQIILAHHGHIKAESELGKGTKITIII